jgi:hypothetical protein
MLTVNNRVSERADVTKLRPEARSAVMWHALVAILALTGADPGVSHEPGFPPS